MDDNGKAKDGGQTRSVWLGVDLPEYERDLRRDVRCHVCVVGGGITGLSVAHELALTGRKVIVLDDGPIGGGESGRTSAHLSSMLDARFVELERLHGLDGARLAADSHRAAIDRIEAIAAEENIDCGFLRMDGYLFTPGAGEPAAWGRHPPRWHGRRPWRAARCLTERVTGVGWAMLRREPTGERHGPCAS